MLCDETGEPDAPVLVVVVNDPADVTRARDEGWYRIPLAHAPQRIAADYLAFYQTGAFPPEERWTIRWCAPVRGYRIARRRELIPEEPLHPRADERYYRVDLGALEALPHPIPSRRLRRITFIATTHGRLLGAAEINDLWVKSTAQERLWEALKQAGVEAERQYPLEDRLPEYVADFALLCRDGRVALLITDEPRGERGVREEPPPDYLLAAGAWTPVWASRDELAADPAGWADRLAAMAAGLGGLAAGSSPQN